MGIPTKAKRDEVATYNRAEEQFDRYEEALDSGSLPNRDEALRDQINYRLFSMGIFKFTQRIQIRWIDLIDLAGPLIGRFERLVK